MLSKVLETAALAHESLSSDAAAHLAGFLFGACDAVKSPTDMLEQPVGSLMVVAFQGFVCGFGGWIVSRCFPKEIRHVVPLLLVAGSVYNVQKKFHCRGGGGTRPRSSSTQPLFCIQINNTGGSGEESSCHHHHTSSSKRTDGAAQREP